MPPRLLPLRANLEWLKKLSKERLTELRAADPNAKLSDAQLAVAREFGFASWPKLKAHVEEQRAQLDVVVPPDVRQRAAADPVAADDPELAKFLAAVEAGETQAVTESLNRRPGLARAHGPQGQTALHVAAQCNDPALAAVLVAYGADVDATFGRSGHSALSWAVTCNATECARTLVQLGAESDLFCAAGIGDLGEVQSLFDERGELVAGAVKTGSSRFGPDGTRLPCPPAAPREQISDALYIACRNRQPEVVSFLLTKQPDLSFRAFQGASALHWAYFGGSPTVIELLLAAGADPEVRDPVLGCTPRSFGICTPANWGFAFLVKARLGEDPALANIMDGRTSPLHEAARNNHIEIVRLLLEAGADPSLTNGDGKTAMQMANEQGHAAVAGLLGSILRE